MSENIDHEAARDYANEAVEFYANNLLANGYRLSNAEQRDYLVSTAYLDLHAQLEEATKQLMYIGDKAVTDWDDPTVGQADRALEKLPDTYKESYIKVMRRAMLDLPKELEVTNAQLAAERARVVALAGLVREAYEMDSHFYDDYSIGDSIPFEESEARIKLTAILKAQEPTND